MTMVRAAACRCYCINHIFVSLFLSSFCLTDDNGTSSLWMLLYQPHLSFFFLLDRRGHEQSSLKTWLYKFVCTHWYTGFCFSLSNLFTTNPESWYQVHHGSNFV
jgi:hypothetical protein